MNTNTPTSPLTDYSRIAPILKANDASFTEEGSKVDHHKIMVIDDVPLNIKLACAHLSAVGYKNFITEDDSTKALARLYQEQPDLLLLDIMMPEVSGLDILEAVRADPTFAHLPILILTAATDRDMKIKALELGATDFLAKPLDAQDLIARVHNSLLVKSYQDNLEMKVRQRTRELQLSQQEVVHCLARAGEYRDNETGQHVIRVSRYVGIIARELGMDREAVMLLQQASTLHDIGKVGIPDAILLKPGKLTSEEYDEMKQHCDYGTDICSQTDKRAASHSDLHATLGVKFLEGCVSPMLRMASMITDSHHEKWDGTGYPHGLKGEAIPLEGRITAVADVFDALSSERPYKKAFPLEKCVAILQAGRDQHFDAKIVDAFLGCLDEVVEIRDKYADKAAEL